MKKTIPSLRIFAIILVVLILSISCRFGSNTSAELQATQESLQSTQIALSVEQTVQAISVQNSSNPAEQTEINTDSSSPEPNTVLQANATSTKFNGVEFEYPEYLFQDVQAEISTDGYDDFKFTDYVLTESNNNPAIMVYSTHEMNKIDSIANEIIPQLKTVLNTQPEHPEKLPFFPNWHAAQFTVMQVDYLTFENGKGVRYLTQYGQNYWPINNQSMFYTFQGITDDGKYYVSAIFPVSHPSLPQSGSDYSGDFSAMENDFDGYLSQIANQINGQADDTFFPQLDHLDGIITSLTIQK